MRLKKEHGVVAADRNEPLILTKENFPDKPIARLTPLEGVLFIENTNAGQNIQVSKYKAAPGVERVPKVTSAQRWRQRLGHVGQGILKKTAQFCVGIEGIDVSELSTCETCHLSKAQKYLSIEPRPVPGESLDEIFIETIRKLPTSLNGMQYTVVLTEAKTRMRWIITTNGKDEIPSELVKWIDYQYNQYEKRIRIVFRDGGTEYLRIKKYCLQHGIRTDVSTPNTPEQNGVSEAANKIVLRRARSMLIDANMPPCFWLRALEHSCYITNRLYCLRTKKTPLIDF